MASQEEKVEGQQPDTGATDDSAEFSGAWDSFEAADAGQPDPASGRQSDQGDGADQEGGEAGQGEALSGTDGGQSAADATPGADAGQPASREQLPDDVLANADPRLKAHIEQLANEKAKAENLARSNGGRLAKALNELAAAKQAQVELSEDEKAKRDHIRQEYDELAEPILGPLERLESEVGRMRAAEVARAESEVADALAAERDALMARHPDLPTIVSAPEYASWIREQTPAIQKIVQDNSQAVVSAADAALVFDLFKSQTGFGQQQPDPKRKSAADRRNEQLDAGRTATGGTQPGVRSDARTNGGTFDDAWDEFEARDRQKAASRR